MNRIIIMLPLVFILLGCSRDIQLHSSIDNPEAEEDFRLKASNHYLYRSDFSHIRNMKELSQWLKENIRYVPDIDDYWENPIVTLKRGWGDCEDIALVAMNIAYVNWGEKYNLALINIRTPELDGLINHADIAKDGKIFNTLNYPETYPEMPSFQFLFDEVFPKENR